MPTESEKKLDAMLTDFEKSHATEGKNLRALLDNTPELKQRLIDAIDKGNLEKIEPLSAQNKRDGAVGVYRADDKTMELPLDYLKIADKDVAAANMIRITAGHEIEHAINRDGIKNTFDKLEKDILTIANGPSPHDYTQTLKTFNTESREREARDEMAGFNILAAHVKRENPSATQEELYRKLYDASPDVQSYFDVKGKAPNQTYEPKAGITFNDKFQVEATKDNVEAFGKYFYDGRGYPASYVGNVIDAIGSIENQLHGKDAKPPEVKVDLKEIGIQGQVTLPGNVIDASPPRLGAPAPDAPAPQAPAEHGHGHSHTGDKQLDEMLSALKDPDRLREAMRNLAESPSGQQFRQDGQRQAQDVAPAQAAPQQEAPAQETARAVGGR
ncbi:MAG: hypothetical protein E6Q50_00320 [Lysobacter sp.]|nr:MAG: hypothetical protein E6Q50_00320 [Lysobacter sp.]